MYGDSSWEEQLAADRAAARKRQKIAQRMDALEARIERLEDIIAQQAAAPTEAKAATRQAA